MATILWNTDVNAPCCPGEIVGPDGTEPILIQTDWDYPGTASSFGWSVRQVQRCPGCKTVETIDADCELFACGNDDCRVGSYITCDHDGTDGTVDCRECGVTATEFITAAGDWLRDNDGATAEDPGYFE